MGITKTTTIGGQELIDKLRQMQTDMTRLAGKAANDQQPANSPSFLDHLKDGVSGINETHKVADRMATDLASGKSENLHETMMAATKAELSFNLMVQMRNKILEAYQEVMRMPV